MTQPGALDGLLILDLSRILAGPTATQLMGDLGATVIKIENPKTKGDDTRAWGPPYAKAPEGETDLSAYYLCANRNKYSVAADLSTEEGAALVRSIAAQADVVIQNYKPGGLVKYGLDHETLLAERPELVYCSISGFGQTGPNRDLPGYDLMAQGWGGIMSITGEADGPPTKVGVGIADVMCGMYATVGILAALRHRDRTGEGQHIDLGLVDTQMSWLVNQGTNYLTSGVSPTRKGNAHPNIVPYDVFETKDGYVILAVGNDGQYQKFCAAFGATDLAEHPDYQTNASRVQHRAVLTPGVQAVLKPYTTAEIVDRLSKVKVPAGPIHSLEEALTSEQAKARGAVIEMAQSDPEAQPLRLLGNPLKMSRTPVSYRKAPPQFGADTDRLKDVLSAHLAGKTGE